MAYEKAGPRTTKLRAGSREWQSFIGVAAEAVHSKSDLYVTVHPKGIMGNNGIITVSVDPPR